jgi:hypothetical protein
MTAETHPPVSKAQFWIGWSLCVLPSALLLFSGAMKLTQAQPVIEGFEHLGYPGRLALALGIVEVGCTVIYLIPRTAILGAILLTGYLGGAIATHVRVLEVQFVGPLVLGVLVWLGIFLRDPRLRTLVPIRTALSPSPQTP